MALMKLNKTRNFIKVESHCQYCFDSFGVKIDEDFNHGLLMSSSQKFDQLSFLCVFNLNDINNPTARDILVCHYFFQSNNAHDHGLGTFLKHVTMSSMAHF